MLEGSETSASVSGTDIDKCRANRPNIVSTK